MVLEVPAALAQFVHAAAQVCRLAPDGEYIRRAAMLHLVNFEGAFIDQWAALPADAGLQGGPTARHGQLAVAVIEGDLDGVGRKAPVIGDGHVHQAWAQGARDIAAIDPHLIGGHRMLLAQGIQLAGDTKVFSQAGTELVECPHQSSPPRLPPTVFSSLPTPNLPSRLPAVRPSKVLPRELSLSSTRFSLMLNSIFRALPSW